MVKMPGWFLGFRCGAASLAGPFNASTLDTLALDQPLLTGIRCSSIRVVSRSSKEDRRTTETTDDPRPRNADPLTPDAFAIALNSDGRTLYSLAGRLLAVRNE